MLPGSPARTPAARSNEATDKSSRRAGGCQGYAANQTPPCNTVGTTAPPRAEGFDPSACEAEPSEAERASCYATYGSYVDDPERAHGPEPLGVALSVAPEVGDGTLMACEGHEGCPLGFQCFEDQQDHAWLELWGRVLERVQDTDGTCFFIARGTSEDNYKLEGKAQKGEMQYAKLAKVNIKFVFY